MRSSPPILYFLLILLTLPSVTGLAVAAPDSARPGLIPFHYADWPAVGKQLVYVWNGGHYLYMRTDGEKYLPRRTEQRAGGGNRLRQDFMEKCAALKASQEALESVGSV